MNSKQSIHAVSQLVDPLYPRKKQFLQFLLNCVSNKSYFVLLICLLIPTLSLELMSDDYYLALRFLDKDLLPNIQDASIWNSFSVTDGRIETNKYLVEHGIMPWWTSLDFKFQMWRPLAEVSHWIDFHLWPDSFVLMHLHQLIWVLLFYFAAYRFFGKFVLNAEIGVIAFIIYSISANHVITIAWLASRNTLMAATFGIAAILTHTKSVETGKLSYSALALCFFTAAILSSEFGLSASVWLFAWTVAVDSCKPIVRFARLIPYGLILLCWSAVYVYGNQGVSESEFYTDPIGYPAEYFISFVEKLPTSIFNCMFQIPAGVLFGTAKLGTLGWYISIVVVAAFVYALSTKLSRPMTRFYVLGSTLSMIPIAAGTSDPRTLSYVSLGIAPLMATLFYDWALGFATENLRKKITTLLVWPLILFSTFSLISLPAVSFIYKNFDKENYYRPSVSLPISESDSEKTVVLLNPNSMIAAIFYPVIRSYSELSQPNEYYPLAMGKGQEMQLTRDSINSFVLTPQKGFLADPSAYFMRKENEAFYEGQILEYPGLQINIIRLLEDGRPASIQVKFRDSLASGNNKILFCENMEISPFVVPKVGQTVTIPMCEQ